VCARAGAAFIIGMSQVRFILGYRVPRTDSLYEQIKVLIEGRSGFVWQVRRRPFVMAAWLFPRGGGRLWWLGCGGASMGCVGLRGRSRGAAAAPSRRDGTGTPHSALLRRS
jgi:hypothetical protein